MWDITYLFCVTWCIRVCDTTRSYVRHASFVCVIRLIRTREPPFRWCGVCCVCVPWLIHVFDMTHSYVWHDAFVCATWLVHPCDMTRSRMRHDSFIHVIRLICMRAPWDMTHSYVWHDAFVCATWLVHTCDMTHSFLWYHSCVCVTPLFVDVVLLRSFVALKVFRDSFIFVIDPFVGVTWLVPPFCWRFCSTQSFRVPWLIHRCDMSHP